MAFEVDPDIRLYTRLLLGRGVARPAAALAACTAGWLLLWFVLTLVPPRYPEAARVSTFMPYVFTFQGALLYLGLMAIVVAPVRAIWRLVDQERNGLLDSARLCGRPPLRMLIGLLVGSSWFLALNGAIALFIHATLQHGGLRVWPVAAIAGGATVAALLLIYAMFPAGLTRNPDNIKSTTAIAVLVAQVLIVAAAEWVRRPSLNRAGLSAAAIGAVALAAWSLRLATPRVARYTPAVPRGSRRRGLLRRLVTPDAPAEFRRQFLYALAGEFAIVLAIALAAVLAVGAAIAGRWRVSFLTVVLPMTPYAMPVLAMVIIASSLQRERETGALDLVRITPQRPLQIVSGRYVGAAVSFWMGALVMSALALVSPRASFALAWLPAVAVGLPALALLDLIHTKSVPEWGFPIVMIAAAAPVAGHLATVVPPDGTRDYLHAHLPALLQRMAIRPAAFDPMSLLPFFGAIVLVATAAGRLKRPMGPSLVGPPAAFGVVIAASAITLFPVPVFPRVLAGLFAVAAALAAEERGKPSPPWPRLAWTGVAAVAAGAVISRRLGFDAGASLATGAAAALALMTGVLIHEVAYDRVSLSFALRFAMFAGLEPVLWSLATGRGLAGAAAAAPTPRPLEVAALAAACSAAALVHARRRAA